MKIGNRVPGKLPLEPRRRDQRGMSIAVILVISIVISAFISALMAGLMPVYRKVASLRYGATMRNLNEAALDWVLDGINNGTVMIPGQADGTSVFVPSSVTGDASARTTVTFSSEGAPPTVSVPATQGPWNTVLYSPNQRTTTNYLLLTATTTKGPLTKKLQVLLEPLTTTSLTSAPGTNFGLFGANVVQFEGLSGINSYYGNGSYTVQTGPNQGQVMTWNPALYADIGTYGTGNQVSSHPDRGTVQGGNQYEYCPTASFGATASILPPPIGTNPGSLILGNIYSNGDDAVSYYPHNAANGATNGPLGGATTTNGQGAFSTVFGFGNGTTDFAGNGMPTGIPSASAYPSSSTTIPSLPSGSSQGSLASGSGAVSGPTPAMEGELYTGGSSPGPQGAGSANHIFSGVNQTTPVDLGIPGTAGVGSNLFLTGTNAATGQANVPYTGGLVVNGANFIGPGVPDPATGHTLVGPNGVPLLPAAPDAPAGSVNLGTITINNGGTLNIVPEGAAAAPTSSIGTIQSGQTVNLPAGAYQVSSISVNSGGTVTVDPGVGANGSANAQFFLNPAAGSNSTATALYFQNGSTVNMSGMSDPGSTSGFTMNASYPYGVPGQPGIDPVNFPRESSGSCSQLQIYSNSNCTMVFGGNARAFVNAPNSTTTIGGTGLASNANFYGAIISGTAFVVSDYTGTGGAAWMHFDAKLRQPAGKDITFNDPWQFNGKTVAPVLSGPSQYRAITWFEPNGNGTD